MNEFGTILLLCPDRMVADQRIHATVVSRDPIQPDTSRRKVTAVSEMGDSNPSMIFTPTSGPVAAITDAVLASLDELPVEVVADERLNSGKRSDSRMTDFYQDRIVPCLLERLTILVLGGLDTLKALRSMLDGDSDTDTDTEQHAAIIVGKLLAYEFDDELHPRYPGGRYSA